MATDAPAAVTGRIIDADSHLYMEPEVMAGILEPIGRDWVVDMIESFKNRDGFEADRERAKDDPWAVKGLAAWGSADALGRVAVMDRMGISRALAFPNTLGRETWLTSDAAWSVVRSYNDYSLQWTRDTGGRSIGVCQLNLTDIDRALAEANRVIAAGARAVCVSYATPPGGTSPANPVWDPLYALLSEANVPLLAHLGATGQFSGGPDSPMMLPRALWDSPTLRSAFPDQPGAEERIGPIWTIIAPIGMEVVLTALVMGGVFERFAALRFGVIEFGAQWLGPIVERMDLHADLMAKVGVGLPLKPSEYVRRNVRVTPFWSEPIDVYIDRYGLAETYMFSTDYPHVEGGKDPVGKFLGRLERFGDEALERFFVTNAELLLPSS
jgi:predicted TIM-barrel fold metal-dependent hydrolase